MQELEREIAKQSLDESQWLAHSGKLQSVRERKADADSQLLDVKKQLLVLTRQRENFSDVTRLYHKIIGTFMPERDF